MTAPEPSKVKNLRTAVVAHELGIQPGEFLKLALKIGLKARQNGRSHLWSEADQERVRKLLESTA
jgi:hypothetical protein